MATVNFLYRSVRDEAQLTARLMFREDGVDYTLEARSGIVTQRDFFLKDFPKKKLIDLGAQRKRKSLADSMDGLRNHIITSFDSVDEGYRGQMVNKEWLIREVARHGGFAPRLKGTGKGTVPVDLLGLLSLYLETNRHNLTESTVKRWKVTREKLERFQEYKGVPLIVRNVNEDMANEWVDYCLNEGYSPNTIKREFNAIKTLCRLAKKNGVHPPDGLDELKVNVRRDSYRIYLTIPELEKIKGTEGLPDYLDNARDWLLISCYTGARVSDLMRFRKEMIRYDDGLPILDYKQVKTGKDTAVPIFPQVQDILQKRGGEFPRPISDQKYNEYLKEVGKLAGLNDMVKGIKTEITDKGVRKVEGTYEKWELITSHIGRRSLATNFFGVIPTGILKNITNHSTEEQLLNYVGKSKQDTAREAFKYVC